MPLTNAPTAAELRALDAWFRAANYLTVGQIYLQDNALLREPLRAEHVKPGAAVLDVGVTREVDAGTGASKVYGDVHPDVVEVAGYVSPNPGGVGPMTVALLMTNVIEAAERL